MRGLLIVLIVALLITLSRFVNTQKIIHMFSNAAGFEPTPTVSFPPIAQIGNYLIDEKGVVVSINETSNLPRIEADTEELYLQYKLDGQGITQTLKFIQVLKQLNLAVEKASLYNEEYTEIIMQDGVRVIYSSIKDPRQTAYILQEMFAIFSIEGESPKTIDLRFEKPAIIY